MNSITMNGQRIERTDNGRIFVNGKEFVDKRVVGQSDITIAKIGLLCFIIGSALTNMVYGIIL